MSNRLMLLSICFILTACSTVNMASIGPEHPEYAKLYQTIMDFREAWKNRDDVNHLLSFYADDAVIHNHSIKVKWDYYTKSEFEKLVPVSFKRSNEVQYSPYNTVINKISINGINAESIVTYDVSKINGNLRGKAWYNLRKVGPDWKITKSKYELRRVP